MEVGQIAGPDSGALAKAWGLLVIRNADAQPQCLVGAVMSEKYICESKVAQNTKKCIKIKNPMRATCGNLEVWRFISKSVWV